MHLLPRRRGLRVLLPEVVFSSAPGKKGAIANNPSPAGGSELPWAQEALRPQTEERRRVRTAPGAAPFQKDHTQAAKVASFQGPSNSRLKLASCLVEEESDFELEPSFCSCSSRVGQWEHLDELPQPGRPDKSASLLLTYMLHQPAVCVCEPAPSIPPRLPISLQQRGASFAATIGRRKEPAKRFRSDSSREGTTTRCKSSLTIYPFSAPSLKQVVKCAFCVGLQICELIRGKLMPSFYNNAWEKTRGE